MLGQGKLMMMIFMWSTKVCKLIQIKQALVVLTMKLKIKVKQVEVINSQYSNLLALQEIIHWTKSLVEFKVVCKLDQD
jgi:hypothetical protein